MNNQKSSSPNVGLATCISRMMSTILYSNCKKPGHTIEYYISKGGGIEGKSIEELKVACTKAWEQKKQSRDTHTKVPLMLKDATGCAFVMMVDPDVLPNTEPLKSEFAGIGSDPLPSASIDEVEYKGWLVTEEEPTTSIDWMTTMELPTEDVFTATTLQQTQCTPVSPNAFPFYVDTGATVYISPEKDDFITLQPIAPCTVK